jgi:alkylmercury lyase
LFAYIASAWQGASARLFGWCAWDTLFIPPLLETRASVESTCPVSGAVIRLQVDRRVVEQLEPSTTRLSFVTPAADNQSEHIESRFCQHIHFLADDECAREWSMRGEGRRIISVDVGFRLGLHRNRVWLGQ